LNTKLARAVRNALIALWIYFWGEIFLADGNFVFSHQVFEDLIWRIGEERVRWIAGAFRSQACITASFFTPSSFYSFLSVVSISFSRVSPSSEQWLY
jgi:hypothetical protein